MNRRARNPLFAAALATGLAIAAGSASAQTCDPETNPECPPPPPPPQVTAACSPGYFKNHVNRWCNVSCPSGKIISPCTDLLTALYSTGPGAGLLKNAAASYINATCYVTREASPCEDD
jgi:hypothetical protein